ncbi:DUF2059 domain-containing protein [Oharaeibacter diazotrophicus]|uniref:DUF2059 domain-containing protein n=1 Tax=Oharaeibacter diazotrophicus TaxID=1920512 RepID=A0A4R6RKN0_9HYPH|nr:DUF2059 domain-containing protein [Oharaeibacter diazotrophicus]TDP86246.1 hypothetical protein EDD54_0115 [Oharaeibacter diazotrophicus]BBE71813.1 hypothetical protein OHA_1_01396 [Pleomorphomonas sp. SM30]GLS78578.1 hypothetical protein GCM10007904_39150 [Oharaeibacter diazotrophicus]
MYRTSSRLRRTAGVLITLALLAGPAAAEDYAASHIAAAREAIAAAHASEQFDAILPVLADQAKALFQRSNPALVQEIDSVVNDVALSLASRRPELERELERVWAARFTEEELKAITAFYESPVGKKFGENMPLVIQDSMRSAGIWRDAISTELVTKSRDELIKRGHQF